MSGPKVVRVVTREELIATCRAQLARLDAAVAAWTRDGRRNDTVSEAEVGAVQRRRDSIAALLENERFLELQKGVQDEIAFLSDDRQDRLQKAAAAEACARTIMRREQDAARALLAALRRSDSTLPQDLEAALEDAARGTGNVSSALSAGFALMSRPSEVDTQRLKTLAKAVKGEERQRTLEGWLETQPPTPNEIALARIEARLGELAVLAGRETAATFETRLAGLRAGAEADRRTLLLDSLALDLGKALADARRRADAQARVEQALAELESFDPAAADRLGGAGADGSMEEIEARSVAVEAAVTQAREAQAAVARRAAVLEALAGLGYEVGEELATAWVEDGRVVLRRPAQPGYGVEVAGGASAERLQMRVVAFGDGPGDPARDRDAEALWCGDVSVLQQRLAAAGAALTIEKALPVGATPVKRLAAVEDRTHARERRAPQARTLR